MTADRGDAERRDRDALLELLLADEGIEVVRAGIQPRPTGAPAVLSAAQERMWFLQQFEDDPASLGIRAAVALRGSLDTAALRRALDEIVRRHEVLRTLIRAERGAPAAVILADAPMPFVQIDVAGDTEALEAALAADGTRTFDLAAELPIAVTLIRVDDAHHVLSVVMHHVASDGSSFAVFFHELGVLYDAYRRDQPSPLPELAIQYQDYAWWQRHDGAETFEHQLEHWRRALAAPLPSFELPTDHRRPARHTVDGRRLSTALPEALEAGVRELCRRTGATPFMVLLAAFDVVLARHAGQTDVVVGTPIAGRVRPELEPMIGAFLNTMVLRNDLGGNPTFVELVEQIRSTSLDAFANQEVPFERVLAEVRPPRDPSRTPLFQVMFNMTNLELGALADLEIELVAQPEVAAKFDLTLYVNAGATGTQLSLVYNRRLFDHDHMVELIDQYLLVLRSAVDGPEVRIGELSMLTAPAAARLPDPTGPLDDSWHGSVPDAIVGVAQAEPERIAVEGRGQRLSYCALATQMKRLSVWLRSVSVERGDIVAIYAHRAAPLLWMVTGVLASGSAYLLLDPRYPPERLSRLLRIAKPRAWLALGPAGEPPPEVTAALDELGVSARLTVGEDGNVIAPDPLASIADDDAEPVAVGRDDLACVTFTSGSTGVPKAVMGRHGSLTHFFPWMSREFGIGPDDRFSMLSGLAHDPIQRDMFWPLWLGATVVVPEPDVLLSPRQLVTWLREQDITVAHLTPAMGQLLTDGLGDGAAGTVPSLRVALFIGDVLTRRDADRLRKIAPNVQVVNLYGTTETQRASGYFVPHQCGEMPDDAPEKEVLPLGTGMPGAQLLVRDPSGRLAGIGEVGDIVMRSPHLGLGYLGDADLTASRFERDPSGGGQLYRTGDRGRYLSSGDVEYLGREDQQVQIRGFRVELGDVQSALREHPAVADAVVRLVGKQTERSGGGGDRSARRGHERLVAYVVAADGAEVDEAAITRWARDRLPWHMVPGNVMAIERVPLTPNGKLDRTALPEPQASTTVSTSYVAPRDELEQILVDVWAETLDRDHVGVHDDFFDLGGYSLIAARLFALVEERTGVQLPVSVLFEYPTVARLADVMRNGGWEAGWSSLVPIQPGGSRRPFFYVQAYMISVLELAPLAEQLGPDQPFYGLQPQGLDGRLPAHDTIEEMAAHYIAEMRAVQPEGPYAIGGHCSGSWVAFEMARQLERDGEALTALVLVDLGPPGVERPRMSVLQYLRNRIALYFRDRRLRHALAWQLRIRIGRLLLRRVGPSTARYEERVKEVHRTAYRLYEGGPVRSDLTLVLSSESLTTADKRWYTNWSMLTSGSVSTHEVGGTHANLLVQPYVTELAVAVVDALDLMEVDAV